MYIKCPNNEHDNNDVRIPCGHIRDTLSQSIIKIKIPFFRSFILNQVGKGEGFLYVEWMLMTVNNI